MRILKFLFAGAVVVPLTACSVTSWEKPGGSDDQLAFDRQECRSLARREIDRVLKRQPLPQADSGPLIGSEYDAAMARYDARRQSDRYFSNCMENKGYQRTSKPLF